MVCVRLGQVDYFVAPAARVGGHGASESDRAPIRPRDFARRAVDEGHAAALAAVAFAFTDAPAWLDPDQLAELVARQIEVGQLSLSARPRSIPRGSLGAGLQPPEPDAVDEPPANEPPNSTTWFEMRLVDEIGEPIDGVRVVIKPGGTIATNGDGVAHVEAASALSAGGELVALDELRELVIPRWDTIRAEPWLEDSPAHSFIALTDDPSTSTYLSPERRQTLVVQPWVVRAKLDGLVFDTNKSFLLPEAVSSSSGVAPIDRLRGWFDAAPDSVALVVGHTDPSGDASYNDPLSLDRAEAFVAYLRRDVDAWVAWYLHPAWEKRWGAHEDRMMLDAVGDRLGLPAGPGRTHAFQTHAGVEADGVIGSLTRRPLIEAYMDLQDLSTAVPEDILVHGCGENFPKLDKPNGAGLEAWVSDPDSEDQRRVEVFLFAAAAGVQPPMPGPNSGPDDPEYGEWVRRSRHTEDLRSQPSNARLTVRVRHHPDHHDSPIHGAQVRLIGPEQAEMTRIGTTDTDGLARFEALAAGRYRLRGDKLGYDGDERIVDVGPGSKAKAPHGEVVMKSDDSELGDGSDDDPHDAELELTPAYEIVSFTGKTDTWSSTTKPATPAGAVDLPDNFVLFQQGEFITLEWAIRCPFEPSELELHQRERSIYDDELEDVVRDKRPGLKLGKDGLWHGEVTLDLNARLEDGAPNPDFEPPLSGGVYRLKMRAAFLTYEAELRVAGVAFFGVLPNEAEDPSESQTLSTSDKPRDDRHKEPMIEVEAVHATPGTLFEHDSSWRADPHGYASSKKVRLAWTVVGVNQAGMHLEILGGEPKTLASYPGQWALDQMSLIRALSDANDGRDQLECEISALTLRAAINVFREVDGKFLAKAQWNSANRLGGSVVLIAEDRERVVVKKKQQGVAELTLSAIDPLPTGPGYYKAYRPKPSSNDEAKLPADTMDGVELSTLCAFDITLEIIERAAQIWAATVPERPFGLGELFVDGPGHKTHGTGRSWDILALRNDPVREYREPGSSKFWLPGDDGAEQTAGNIDIFTTEQGEKRKDKTKWQKTVFSRDHPKNPSPPTFDPVGMKMMIMLFIDLLELLPETNKRAVVYQQVIFNDEIAEDIKTERPHVNVGTEMIMTELQRTHIWHVHLQIRVPDQPHQNQRPQIRGGGK